MSGRPMSIVIDAAALADRLEDPNLVLLDGTTEITATGPRPCRAAFEQARIPGAQFVDIDREWSDPAQAPGLNFSLPRAEHFSAAAGRLGIGPDTFVVCYATGNHWWASRLWWTLRAFGHDNAAVLDGGFQRWTAEHRPIETGPGRPRSSRPFAARFRPELVATKQDVLAAIGDGAVCTVNALPPEQHRGEATPSTGRPGHITGSVNVPAARLVGADNRFKPLDELRDLLAEPLSRPRVITYCGGGISASSPTLLLTLLGHADVRLYDASLAEWAGDASLPMEIG